MKSYLDIIKLNAEKHGVTVLQAFKAADIPTSTYYRTINGDTEIRYETALRVVNAIEKLYLLQQARKHTKGLRETGKRVDRRSIRAEFKPRSSGS